MDDIRAGAEATIEMLRGARLECVELEDKLRQADYAMRLDKARVERELIKKVGGEKALAPSAEDRERIYVRALDADPGYVESLNKLARITLECDRVKVEITYLREKLALYMSLVSKSGQLPDQTQDWQSGNNT